MAKKKKKPLKLEYVPRKTKRYSHPVIKRLYREYGKEANHIIHIFDRLDDFIFENGGYVTYDNLLFKKLQASMCQPIEDIKKWVQVLLEYDLFDQRCMKDNILTSYDMQIALCELGLRLRNCSLSIPYKFLLVPMEERMNLCLAPSADGQESVKQYREHDYTKLFPSDEVEVSVQEQIDKLCPYLNF